MENSIRALEKACELSPGNYFTLGMLAYGFGKAGMLEEARTIVEKLQTDGMHSYVPAKSLMFAYAGLNDASGVLTWTEKSLHERDPMTIMNLSQEPVLDFVRSDARYQSLLRKVNLQL